MQSEFPGTKIFARSYDRGHTLQLLAKNVDYELRETFESAMRFGRETLVAIGIDADRAAIVEDFIRTRDRDRLASSRPRASTPAPTCCASGPR